MRFHAEPLIVLVNHLRAALAAGASPAVIEVPDPDLGRGRFAGEGVGPEASLAHRPLRAWCDLAEALRCRLLTPRAVAPTHVELRFEPLGEEAAFHRDGRGAAVDDRKERYGAASDFARFRRLEDPGFLLPYLEALGRLSLAPGDRILALGVNRGDELAALAWLPGAPELSFVGIDHSASALAEARRRFPQPRHRFLEADLDALPDSLGTFSLVLCLGTLQSPGVDDRALLRLIVQRLLTPGGSLLLGLPNCRFRDGEALHGARLLNLREPDLSLLVDDLAFYRRYLHQHGFRTFLNGKYELLLTAVPGTKPRARSGSAGERMSSQG